MLEFIKDQIANNDFFTAGLSVSIFSGILFLLKDLPRKIGKRLLRNFTYQTVLFEHSVLYEALEQYLKENHSKQYCITQSWLRNGKVEADQLEDTFVIRYKGSALLISKSREKMESGADLQSQFLISFKISGFSKKKVHQLLESVNAELSAKQERHIYTHDSYCWIQVKSVNRNIKSLYFEKEFKDNVISRISNFKKAKQRYSQLGIPYKLGISLYGKPGNGKTSLVEALGTYFNMNVCYLNLSILKDDTGLNSIYRNIPENSILVIEDADTFFNGRKIKTNSSKVTFSGVLNVMDGAFYKEGLITIMTTNHINTLDSAILRPGRIDTCMEINNPTKEVVEKYLQKYYEDENIEISEEYEPIFSMAEIVDNCLTNEALELIENYKTLKYV